MHRAEEVSLGRLSRRTLGIDSLLQERERERERERETVYAKFVLRLCAEDLLKFVRIDFLYRLFIEALFRKRLFYKVCIQASHEGTV